MKNQDINTITKTARMLDSDSCLKGSLVPPEVVWAPEFNKPIYPPPPPTLQTISILSHKTFTASANVPSLRPRAIPFDGIRRELSLLPYFFSPTLLFAPRVATFWGNEI